MFYQSCIENCMYSTSVLYHLFLHFLHTIHGNCNTYKSFIGKEGKCLYRMISMSCVGGLKKSTVHDYEASSL